MSMKFLLIASFFVALLTMLGAAPMCRRIAAQLHPRNIHNHTPVGVGGVVMAFALFLVSFYLTPLPESANSLLNAILVVLLFNGVLWWRFAPQRARLWRNRLGPIVMLIVVMGMIGLPQDLVFDSTGAILTAGFAVVLTMTPLALAGLGDRFRIRSAMSPSYLIFPALVGLLIVGLKADFSSGAAFQAEVDVIHVLLPTFGAIAGCSFYTIRLPWRNSTQVCMGASGQMIMGMVCGWAAIEMAVNGPRPGATMVALLWMMLPALFEVGREQIRTRIAPMLDPNQVPPRIIHWLKQPTSVVFIYSSAFIMLIIGLVSFWTPNISVWASGVAIPFAFGAYVLAGGWLRTEPLDTANVPNALETSESPETRRL